MTGEAIFEKCPKHSGQEIKTNIVIGLLTLLCGEIGMMYVGLSDIKANIAVMQEQTKQSIAIHDEFRKLMADHEKRLDALEKRVR